MRRVVAVAMVGLLVASACSGDDDDRAAPQTTMSTTAPTTTTEDPDEIDRVAHSDECTGLGAVPADGAITWISDGRLWQQPVEGGEPTCLLEASSPSLEWGGAGDRVRIGDTIVVGDDIRVLGSRHRHLHGLSRPTGTAVLARATGGELLKLPLGGGDEIELPSFFRTEEATYHPAGTAIVSVQPFADGPGLILASNLGHDPRSLVDNETAIELRGLTFTESGDLLFVAAHDGRQHVHRLEMATNTLSAKYELEVADGSDESIHHVAASPFRDDGVAVSVGGTHQLTSLWVERDGAAVELAGTPVERGAPIAWLPDGGLLVGVYEDDAFCCDAPPFDLYVVGSDSIELVDRGVDAAAVRAVLPPPPPPPPDIEQAAPA